MDRRSLKGIRYLIIDMDGVLYRGAQPTPGLTSFFATLAERGIQFSLVTNNSGRSREDYVAKLRGMGVEVGVSAVLTSAAAAALYLRQRARPQARIYVVGEEALRSAVFGEADRQYVWDEETPDYVVVGVDWGCTYEKLKKASLAIRRGAEFIATNADATLPTEEGELPGAGALVAALEVASGKKPLVLGKPEPLLFRLALESLGASTEESAVIGDRLSTDIAGGQRLGLTTILVLTGVTGPADLETSAIKPDFVFNDLTEISREFSYAAGRREREN